MTGVEDDLGTYTTAADGKIALRFERTYPRGVATVWAALTEPERLKDWLGPCEVEPRLGGKFNCFTNRDLEAQTIGEVTAWEPPSLLEFTWGHHDDPDITRVRAELTALGPNETKMVFTHYGLDRKWMAMTLAGWHQLLERLTVLNETGAPAPDDTDMARWTELRDRYIAHYRLEGVLKEPPLPMEKYK